MAPKPRLRLVSTLIFMSVALPPATLGAQGMPRLSGPHFKNRPILGVGYVANIPATFLGFSALATTPGILGGAGLYAAVKFTSGSPKNTPEFVSTISPSDAELTYGDLNYAADADWFGVDLAVVYAVAPEMALYGGAGYAKRTGYKQYYDDSATRGLEGFYWVADPDHSGNRLNVLGGMLMRVSRFLLFQVGAESQPVGVSVGVTVAFAR